MGRTKKGDGPGAQLPRKMEIKHLKRVQHDRHYSSGMDEGHPISFRVLARGTPVWASDDQEIGTVDSVLATDREDIFDGIVIRTTAGRRFVDAPEVARIAERRVTLTITAAQSEQLPEPARGGQEFHADPAAGRWSRFFGGGWRRR
jgi:hypothetical protein